MGFDCAERKDTTTYCSIKDFCNANNDGVHNESIMKITQEILKNYHQEPKEKILKAHVSNCFIINESFRILKYYYEAMLYFAKLLIYKKHMIRYEDFLIHDKIDDIVIVTNESIKIKHQGFIHNALKYKNNNNEETTYVIFTKTPKRNDVYFE